MESARECLCCREVERILLKQEQDNVTEECITLHPGFSPVYLNIWVLQTAYFNYRTQYGTVDLPASINE